MRFLEHLIQESFAKRTYRDRRQSPNQPVDALVNEYIDMIEIHDTPIEEMFPHEEAWGQHFDMLMDYITESYHETVIKKVKEHYNV